ncbi:MAG TPA: HAMP domain-containing sensor histidine kinase [Polyangiaceae bacterium]|nr:HAMP domain-containing sensor histidine kinase [Polyangiaceae bacterium]
MSSAPSSSRRAGSAKRAWRSLSARLALWYVLVIVGSFFVAAFVFALRLETSVQREGNRSAEGALERYRQALESGGTDALRAMFDCSPAPASRFALRLTDERDVELFGVSSDEDSRRVAVTSGERAPHAAPFPAWHVAKTQVSQQRTLSIAMHDDGADHLFRELRETSWLIFGAGLGLAILGATFITRRTLRPVTALAEATERIVRSGDLGLRVETRASTDELAHLSALFNRMLAKNESLVKAMRESLDNVAHDLRTPLTRLRAGAELALRGAPDTAHERDALAEVIEESDLVLGMLTTLTDIVEAEAGAMRLDKHREDLGAIAREAVDLYDLVSKEGGVGIVTHIAANAEIFADRRRITQVCANLIDNAVKYTPAGGRVEVCVLESGTSAIFRVTDTGIGIAPEDRAHVWDRLFRADRSRGARGLGLGLSLVKAVVEAHGGEVTLSSELGTGSTFEVRLPRAP